MPTKGMKPLRRALGVVEDHLRTYDIDVLDNTYFLIAHGREAGELVKSRSHRHGPCDHDQGFRDDVQRKPV